MKGCIRPFFRQVALASVFDDRCNPNCMRAIIGFFCCFYLLSLPLFAQSDTTQANIYYEYSTSFLQRGRLDSMHQMLALAAPLYQKHGLSLKEAHCYNRMGYALHMLGKNIQSARLYRKAIHLYDQVLGPTDSYSLGTRANLSYLYQEEGKMDSALAINLECISLSANKSDVNPEFLVNFYYNAGIFSQDMGRFFVADSLLRLAEQTAYARLPADHPGFIPAYMGFGKLYLAAGLIEEAAEYYEKALHLLRLHGRLDGETGAILHNLAQAYMHQGRREKANSYYQQIINIHQQLGLDKSKNQSGTLMSFATSLIQHEDAKKAIPFLQEAYDILESFETDVPVSRLYCESMFGQAYSQLGQFQLAETWFDRARYTLQDIQKEHSITSYYRYYFSYSDHLTRLGQTELALEVTETGLQQMIKQGSSLPLFISELLIHKANLLVKQKNWESAMEAVELAQSYVLPNVAPDIDLEEVNENMFISRYYGLRTLASKAQIAQQAWTDSQETHYLDIWLNTSLNGCRLLKQSIQGYAHPEEKQQLIHTTYGLFQFGISAIWQEYQANPNQEQLDRLWTLMEDTKAIVLSQTLQKLEQQQFVHLPKTLMEEEQELQRNVSYTRSQISHARANDIDSQQIFRLERDLLSHQLAYEQWFKRIQDHYPEYTELRYGTRSTSLAELQAQLPVNSALIEFSFAEDDLICLRIDRDGVQAFELHHHQDSLYQQIDSLLLRSQKKDHQFIDLGHELYQILLEPILKGRHYDKLVLIPDGKLNEIPFELLLIEPGQLPLAYPSLAYLIKEYAITYNYSGHFWANNFSFSRPSNPKQNLLAMAPMGPQSTGFSRNRLTDAVERTGLSPLPNSIREIQAVQEILGGKAVVNAEATEELFHQESSKSRILHLATHSVINNSDPLMSYLMLSPTSDSIPEEDGFLHAHELYNLHLDAELVTLSACNTGVGTIRNGEGVVCLARGFAYAGCPNLVMSLWAVPDAATSELMTSFYQGLDQGMDKDEALRQAKLTYIQNSPPERTAPYYWGAWVLVGDQKPLRGQKASGVWIGGILVLLLIGGWYVGKKYKRMAHT